MNKKIYSIIIGIIIIFSFINSIGATSHIEYTRENSEELFHLINWQDYGPEAFEQALREQKPIFLMISAPAWCYWCHVYESRDYLYNENLYPYLNENFVIIFVDSDKRPDLTRKYLEGGWPSTTIFTPNFQRINGFSGPRDPNTLRSFFEEIVAFIEDGDFTRTTLDFRYQKTFPKIPTNSQLFGLTNNFIGYVDSSYDSTYGGFGTGQKFPRGLTLKYLLEQYEKTGNEDYLNRVQKTFDNQYTKLEDVGSLSDYHLYDPVEGGFHRYTTRRDWTIPHYEKMIFDQAKLIRAYAHLQQLTNTPKVDIAVDKSINYIIEKLYDPSGGFYNSQDAHLEEEYYGLTEEERAKEEPPFIDETRIIDGNSMMISTFLYLYETTSNEQYRKVAENSLNFIQNNMISEDRGVYHYFDHEKKDAFLTGQTVSNSWSLLAFVEGYETLNENNYLETSKKIADYSLDNLYDWTSGGFFNRNSLDKEFYAPNERIDLSKPYEENAVFAYGMLKLYSITGNQEYLEAGMKTLGFLLSSGSGLDQTYYVLKSSEYVIENNLLQEYTNKKNEIQLVLDERQEGFFLEELLAKEQTAGSLDGVPVLANELGDTGFILLALLALLAGVLSFLSPCTLPVLTAYFAANIDTKKGETIRNTLFFFLGMALIFSLFGMGATFLGFIFREQRGLFTKIAGLVIIGFGLLEISGRGFSGFHLKMKFGEKGKKTPVGMFLFGIAFGIGWSACTGPILASLLLLSATTGTIIQGSALLFIYALGLGIPLFIISIYFDKIKDKEFWKILKGKEIAIEGTNIRFHTTSLIAGILLIIIGILIFNDFLFRLNQYALQTEYVQNIIVNGEGFLKRIFVGG